MRVRIIASVLGVSRGMRFIARPGGVLAVDGERFFVGIEKMVGGQNGGRDKDGFRRGAACTVNISGALQI